LYQFSQVIRTQKISLFDEGFTVVTGESSAAAIVLSNLITVALYVPLRRKIQAFIDRGFFRRKYNVEKVLARFAQTAREEVNVERLAQALLNTIQETMQPELISLWLCPIRD
jgi:hypothetical protein